MPSHVTVYSWLNDKDKRYFLNAYSTSLRIALMIEADELNYLADNVEPTSGAVQKATLQIKTRMWRLSKLESKKYGDHIEAADTEASQTPDLSALTPDEKYHWLKLKRKMNGK